MEIRSKVRHEYGFCVIISAHTFYFRLEFVIKFKSIYVFQPLFSSFVALSLTWVALLEGAEEH